MDGIGRYSTCMIDGLRALDTDNEYVVFTTQPRFHFESGGAFTEVVYPYRHVHPASIVHFQRELHVRKVDVLYCPHFYAPPMFRGRTILTIHDLMWFGLANLQMGEGRPAERLKAWAHRVVVPLALRRADAVVTVSEASARDIRRFFPGLKAAVDVIPLGIDHLPIPERILPPDQRDPYILFVGNAKPYKNLDNVVRCFDLLTREAPFGDWRLRIPGRPDNNRDVVGRVVDQLPCRDRVDWLGSVSDTALGMLYAHASLLLFPSRYEGFGLPVLEAMWHGTPVVTSTTSSLPEVAGDCAVLVDPENVPAMVDACRGLLLDPRKLADLAARGVERARGYRWEDAVRRTHEVLVR